MSNSVLVSSAPISILDEWVNSRPKHVAFIARDEIWTYQRLATEADRVARGFWAHGARPGDRIALHMANLPEMIVAYDACFRIGAIASPLNNRFKTAQLKVLPRLQPNAVTLRRLIRDLIGRSKRAYA